MLKATPVWADLTAIEAVYKEAAKLTRATGIKYEVDHFFPLQGNTVCGLHVLSNLRIITKTENIQKGNRVTPHTSPPQWPCDGVPTQN